MSDNTTQNKTLVDKARDYLADKGVDVSDATSPASKVKGINNLIDALLAKSLITIEQYNSVKFEAINTNKSIDELIKEKNIVKPKDLSQTYAEMLGMKFVDLDEVSIESEILNKIPQDVAKSYLAIPFEETQNSVKVAMKDPLDLQKVKYLEGLLAKKVETFFAVEESINRIIDTKYGAQLGTELDEALEEVESSNLIDINKSPYSDNDLSQDLGKAPIIKIVNMILDYGIKNKASDVHIEPREKKIAVRFRVRGILSEKLTIPRSLLSPLVTRIKILSDLKIDEHRVPQDGRFQVKSGNSYTDIRVSVMPSIFGEKIVMRLLQKSQTVLSLEDLGLRGTALARLKDALKRTQGIILVTGPTGSGKTQTLASCLKILNTSEVNISTLEDPVEIRIDGVNQVQVNAEVGLTFATGLRSFLRQDPDVILVGEIRDAETASLSVQAALVGRLVLSTVHTNSAAGAFVRLMDMGVESFLLTSTVNLVLGQRLVRVLCECKKAVKATDDEVTLLHKELDFLGGFNIFDKDHNVKLHFDTSTKDITLYHPVGCPKCNDSGYISRTGIFEALKISESISKEVLTNPSINGIADLAVKEGMMTMVQDGFIKAVEGITTLEEVLRVKNE